MRPQQPQFAKFEYACFEWQEVLYALKNIWMDLDLPFNEMFLKTSKFKPIFTEIKADLSFAQPW